MISTTQMLYCFVAGGVYLLVATLVLEFLNKKLNLKRGISPDILEQTTGTWFVLLFLMEFLFFVAIPTISYSFLYLIVPLSGIRAGLAAALFAFTLGAVPVIMGLSVRVRLPMPYLLFTLLGYLVKLAGALAIVGYLYTL